MANTVAVLRATRCDEDGIENAVYKALELIGYDSVKTPETVAIKVNLCYYWDYTTGETTDVRVVSSVIDYVRERWNKEAWITIVESDASAVRMRHAFRMLGYEDLAAKKGVRLSNLSEEPSESVDVSAGGHNFEFRIPQAISKSDVFISVPKPKYHITGISCALKNQFGCNPVRKKFFYHPQLDEAIVALNKIMKPDVVLVDGIIARGDSPKKLGLIAAGTNPLSVDFTMAKIMGLNPYKIRHLRLAIEENIGEVQDMSFAGENMEEIAKEFPQMSSEPINKKLVGKVKLSVYDLYLRLIGIPLF